MESINSARLLSRSNNNSAKRSSRMFECKTCNRQFPSFQALGGHRTSHRKPRHIGFEETLLQAPQEPTKPRIHECSICGIEFPLGQALGGHMRRHRTNNTNVIMSKQQVRSVSVSVSGLNLDLNLAPPESESEADCREHDSGGIDLELQLDLALAEKVRFAKWLH